MALKIAAFVNACKECPNYQYDSGGVYECRLVREPVLDKERIASFCPLSDYPSRQLAEQEATIAALRTPLSEQSVVSQLLSLIASRAGVLVSNRGTVSLLTADGGTVVVRHDTIGNVDVRHPFIQFHHGEHLYRLLVHRDGVELQKQVSVQNGREGEWWCDVPLMKKNKR